MRTINKRIILVAAMAVAIGISVPAVSAVSAQDNDGQRAANRRAVRAAASDVAQRQLEQQQRARIQSQDQARSRVRQGTTDGIRPKWNIDNPSVRSPGNRPTRPDRNLRRAQIAVDPSPAQTGRTGRMGELNIRIGEPGPSVRQDNLNIRIDEPGPSIRPDSPIRPAPVRRRTRFSTDTEPVFIPPVNPGENGRRARIAVDAPDTGSGRSVNADVSLRAAMRTDHPSPTRFTSSDVQLYDNVFGRFNPLRSNPGNIEQRAPSPRRSLATEIPRSEIPVTPRAAHNRDQIPRRVRPLVDRPNVDLATRIDTAIRQRRTQISLFRDAAIEQSDPRRMRVADQMEATLNTFVRAQTLARESSVRQAAENTGARQIQSEIPRPAYPGASSNETGFRR